MFRMCISARTMLLLLAGVSAAFAVVIPRHGPIAMQMAASDATFSLGAFYFMTNDPNSNMVVASQINADGTLTPVSATATGGRGGSGLVDPPAEEHPDALFTQDAVIVRGNMLFAVNAGSGSLSMLAIDPSDPTRLTLKAQKSTGGDFPASVAANADGTMVCALNSGSQSNVVCFAVHGNKLKAIANSQRTLGIMQSKIPAGPGGTVSDIVFMNDGSLAVSVKGTSPTAPGNVQVFSVKNNTLSEKPLVVPAAVGGALPFSLSVPLDGSNVLFATDAAAGVSTFDFSGIGSSVNNTGEAGATSVLTAIEGQGATCWSAQSTVTQSFFTSDVLTSQITEFSASGAGAKQLATYQLGNSTGSIDLNVASTKVGDFLYVTGSGNKSLVSMAVGATPGNVTMLQTLDLTAAVGSALNLTQSIQGAAVFVKKDSAQNCGTQ